MTEYKDIYKYPNIKKCHMIRQINVEKGKEGQQVHGQTDRRQRQQKKRRNQLKIEESKNIGIEKLIYKKIMHAITF